MTNDPNHSGYEKPTAPDPAQTAGVEARVRGGEGISAFGVLIAVSFLFLLSFFSVGLFAIGKRWANDAPRTNAPSTLDVSAPAVAAPAEPVTVAASKSARVVVPAKLKAGVLRADPTTDGALVAYVPNGATVDVGRATVTPTRTGPQVWYRIRAVVNGVTYEGWMHSDILRMP